MMCISVDSIDSVMHPSKWNTLFRASWKYLPTFVLDFVDYIPTREYKRFRHTTKVINKVSKQLIEEKTEALLSGGQTSKDVMSILGASPSHLPCPADSHVCFNDGPPWFQCAQTCRRTRKHA